MPDELPDVLLLNYEMVHKHRAQMDALEWDVLVCDEAHFLKNPDAQRTQALLVRVKVRVRVSPNPNPNHNPNPNPTASAGPAGADHQHGHQQRRLSWRAAREPRVVPHGLAGAQQPD